MVQIACRIKPDIVTLVPERRQERTTEGGLDLKTRGLGKTIASLRSAGIVVSLFITPELETIERALGLGAETVELHTGEFCHCRGKRQKKELRRLEAAAERAQRGGLLVAAGHGLDYFNVEEVARIPAVEELNVGHAIISRAIFVGLDRAVRDMITLLNGLG